jgi:hypothetical protein
VAWLLSPGRQRGMVAGGAGGGQNSAGALLLFALTISSS